MAFSRNLATFSDALRSSDGDLRAVLTNGIESATAAGQALDHSVDADACRSPSATCVARTGHRGADARRSARS